MSDAIQQFRDALARRGIVPPADVLADGFIHRCDAEGQGGKGDAAYLLHVDGIPAGGFENWRDGLGWQNWRGDAGRPPTPAEEAAYRARIETVRQEREVEEAKRKAEAREKAGQLWAEAHPCTGHAYLTRKGIAAHGARLYRQSLVLPIRDTAGTLHSLQFIGADGGKRYLGGGRIRGCYYGIGKPDGLLCIAEGFATGASIHEATGYAVAVAFDAGNLQPAAQALREKFPSLRLILCADDDYRTEGNPGLSKAREAALAVGGFLAVPDFSKNRLEGMTDFNDLHQVQEREAVSRCIDAALNLVTDNAVGGFLAVPDSGKIRPDNPIDSSDHHHANGLDGSDAAGKAIAKRPDGTEDPADEFEYQRLAQLPKPEYDRQRKEAATRLGIRVITLDEEVEKRRPTHLGDDLQGQAMLFEDPEPWDEAVAGVALLGEIKSLAEQCIHLPDGGGIKLALWTVLTYLLDWVDCAPLLVLASPEKRCGKTTVLVFLDRLVNRPLAASNITSAAMFRAIEQWQPTLLIDEADSFLPDNEGLRGILNSGHTRSTAYVIRTVGEDFEPRRFSTWGAKALAAIGTVPPTIQDRSLVLRMERKFPTDKVKRIREIDPPSWERLRRQLARWALDHGEEIRKTKVILSDELNDRERDNWEPLFQIASVAGGSWLEEARRVAIQSDGKELENEGVGIELLGNIREILDQLRTTDPDMDQIPTAQLVSELCANDTWRWNTFNQGKPINPHRLSRLLGHFKIRPGTFRQEENVLRGYQLADFEDVFSRYLPFSNRNKCNNPIESKSYDENESATKSEVLQFENPRKPAPNMDCSECSSLESHLEEGGDIEAFEERAAIMELDGGMSRAEAERLAAESLGKST